MRKKNPDKLSIQIRFIYHDYYDYDDDDDCYFSSLSLSLSLSLLLVWWCLKSEQTNKLFHHHHQFFLFSSHYIVVVVVVVVDLNSKSKHPGLDVIFCGKKKRKENLSILDDNSVRFFFIITENTERQKIEKKKSFAKLNWFSISLFQYFEKF